MRAKNKIKQALLLLLPGVLLAACAPTENLIQTAIVQTQTAAPTATATGLSLQDLLQTAVGQTLTPAIAALSTNSAQQMEAAVQQSLTASVPTATATPLISSTPTPPTPTITNTHGPWPTITNTPEPYIPSGPITLTKVEALGDNKVELSWEAEGSFFNGFAVVWSPSNAAPAMPDSYWYSFANGHMRSAEVDVKLAKTYYFRVCELNEKRSCISYSNTIQANVQ